HLKRENVARSVVAAAQGHSRRCGSCFFLVRKVAMQGVTSPVPAPNLARLGTTHRQGDHVAPAVMNRASIGEEMDVLRVVDRPPQLRFGRVIRTLAFRSILRGVASYVAARSAEIPGRPA